MQVPSLGWLQIVGFAGIVELNIYNEQVNDEPGLIRLCCSSRQFVSNYFKLILRHCWRNWLKSCWHQEDLMRSKKSKCFVTKFWMLFLGVGSVNKKLVTDFQPVDKAGNYGSGFLGLRSIGFMILGEVSFLHHFIPPFWLCSSESAQDPRLKLLMSNNLRNSGIEDPEVRKKKLNAELANGRLAMFAIIGMFFQDRYLYAFENQLWSKINHHLTDRSQPQLI